MFDTRTMLFFFACLKYAAGAGAALRIKAPAPAPGSDPKKIGSGSGDALKVAAPGGSGSTTLIKIVNFVTFEFKLLKVIQSKI